MRLAILFGNRGCTDLRVRSSKAVKVLTTKLKLPMMVVCSIMEGVSCHGWKFFDVYSLCVVVLSLLLHLKVVLPHTFELFHNIAFCPLD